MGMPGMEPDGDEGMSPLLMALMAQGGGPPGMGGSPMGMPGMPMGGPPMGMPGMPPQNMMNPAFAGAEIGPGAGGVPTPGQSLSPDQLMILMSLLNQQPPGQMGDPTMSMMDPNMMAPGGPSPDPMAQVSLSRMQGGMGPTGMGGM